MLDQKRGAKLSVSVCRVPRPELCGRIIDALNTAVYKEFTRLGIEILYARQDLYIMDFPQSLGALAAGKVSTRSAESLPGKDFTLHP